MRSQGCPKAFAPALAPLRFTHDGRQKPDRFPSHYKRFIHYHQPMNATKWGFIKISVFCANKEDHSFGQLQSCVKQQGSVICINTREGHIILKECRFEGCEYITSPPRYPYIKIPYCICHASMHNASAWNRDNVYGSKKEGRARELSV